jgi:arsenate reductase-like glutaredoxin family protein
MPELKILTQDNANAFELLEKAISNELTLLTISFRKTQKKIKEFEQKYGMKLEEALASDKKMDHDELIEWEGEVAFYKTIARDLKELKGLKICP